MFDWRYAAINEPSYKVLRRKAGRPPMRQRSYCEPVGAFDIETSTIYIDGSPHSFMYIWQFAIDDNVYYGRTWDEFKEFLLILRRKVPQGAKLLTYTHNLSYEYVWLSGIFDFSIDDVFATDPRKILFVQLCEWVEIRCSYFLTNMTLKKFLQTEGVPVQKEELDYKQMRYPWTRLTAEELSYCSADVLGLTQAVRARAKKSGDNWYSIPFTATGYIRRVARKVMRKTRGHDRYTFDCWEVYRRLTRAFRGGNTHASRFYAALGVVKELVYSRDFSSEYPYIITSRQFPSREFFIVPPEILKEAEQKIEYVERLMSQNYAVLFTVRLYDVAIDEDQPVPYIPFDKCNICRGGALDNGRILSASALEITLTDVDWNIIKSMYTWRDAVVMWAAYSQYAPPPDEYIALTREYYRLKTELKGVDDYMYRRSKELLNSLYG